jgi:hypothetical protein
MPPVLLYRTSKFQTKKLESQISADKWEMNLKVISGAKRGHT